MQEFQFSSHSGMQLQGYRWVPEGQPVAVVQILHGVAEYALRYDAFARFLSGQGFLVVAHDHMGHGKSGGTPLHFPDGWAAVREDCHTVYGLLRKEYPHLPYVLFGHSMGSFLLRSLLYTHPEMELSCAVICGTGWQPAPILRAGQLVCKLEKLRLGATTHSKLMNSLMFGAYNSKFKDAQTPNDWISSTPSRVREYTDDPLCGGPISVGLADSMLSGMAQNQKMSNLKKMPKNLPVLFIAGQDDPVGAMGKGVQKSAKRFRKAGMQSVKVHLCKGRHEILLEAHCKEIYETLLEFIKNCIIL